MIKATYSDKHGVKIEESEVGQKWRGGGHFNLSNGATNVRRKRWWTIVVTYDTPSGSQELTIKPPKKCYLAQVSGQIAAAMSEDERKTGGIKNIQWTAIGR